jgi:hypothetical protein
MIVGASPRNGIKTMKSESCSYRRLTRTCQFVNAGERGERSWVRGHRLTNGAASVVFVDVRLACIDERCFILLSGLRSERLLILDCAWVSGGWGSAVVKWCIRLALVVAVVVVDEPDADVFVPSVHIQRRQP